MSIRIILGPPCAGKTSFVEENAAPGDVRLDWDMLAGALDAHPAGLHSERQKSVAATAFYARGVIGHWLRTEWKARRDDGTEAVAWVIATSGQAIGIEDYIAAGAKVTLLDPGEAECLRRCREDGRPDGTEDAIRKWYETPPEIPETWIYRKGARMRAKNIRLNVKAAGGEAAENPFGGELLEGDFIAYASTFTDEPDSYGDVVMPGAFTNTLTEWAEKGAPIPLLYGHRMDDPAYNIGHIVDAKEDETGLLVWGRIDLETEAGVKAYRLIKARRLAQLSFAFDVVDGKENEHGGLDLHEVTLHEVSLVQLGANRHTSVLAVKAAADVVQTTSGEFTDEEHEQLRDATDQLREALSQLEALLATIEQEPNENNDRDGEDATDDATAPEASPDGGDAKAAAAMLALALATSNLDEQE